MFSVTVYKDKTLTKKKTYQASAVHKVAKGWSLIIPGRPGSLLIPSGLMVIIQAEKEIPHA